MINDNRSLEAMILGVLAHSSDTNKKNEYHVIEKLKSDSLPSSKIIHTVIDLNDQGYLNSRYSDGISYYEITESGRTHMKNIHNELRMSMSQLEELLSSDERPIDNIASDKGEVTNG